MHVSALDFPREKPLVFYGAGPYGEDFVRRRCVEEGKIRLPDCFCDDRMGGEGKYLFGVPMLNSAALTQFLGGREMTVVVLALAGGNLAIPGKNAQAWDFCDVRLGRCLDMRFEVETREANGDFQAVRRLLADEKSRQVFDFMTKGLADGAIWCRSIYEPHPYFGNDAIPTLRDGEVYIDAGACRGEDIARFVQANPSYGRVVAFEPDDRVFPELAVAFSDPRIEVRQQGLSDAAGMGSFDCGGACGRLTQTSEPGSGRIETVRLDDCGIDGVSLLKMDVEGSEAAALRGAAKTIAGSRPRLAVSAYHLIGDLFDLPRLVDGLRPGSRLLLRQHSVYTAGTVLYAI